MTKQKSYFDTRAIIVNLLKEDKETYYLSFSRLHELLRFIFLELKEKCKLDDYQISFDVGFDAIERTVIYNNNIFSLDIDEGKIYLREPQKVDMLAEQYCVDVTVRDIIKEFINAA